MSSCRLELIVSEREYLDEDGDHLALFAAVVEGAALCTVVGIEGSFSRRLGAQLAILPDGTIVGTLADGCLERQLLSDCRQTNSAVVQRYGSGSGTIDFTRYPSGHLGVPAAFPHQAFRKLSMFEGDRGAAGLDWGPGLVVIAPASPDTLIDVDTPDDLNGARTILAHR